MGLITIPFHQTFVGNVEGKIHYILAMILAYCFVLLYAMFLKMHVKRNINIQYSCLTLEIPYRYLRNIEQVAAKRELNFATHLRISMSSRLPEMQERQNLGARSFHVA